MVWACCNGSVIEQCLEHDPVSKIPVYGLELKQAAQDRWTAEQFIDSSELQGNISGFSVSLSAL